jgi:hypothetical protein
MIEVLTEGGISLRSASWIMSEAAYSLYRLLKVADADGTIAGLPVIASAGAAGSVMLAAAEYVTILLGDGVTLFASGEGALEMDTAPTHDAVTPTETTLGEPVPDFQTHSVALSATIYANWQVGGPVNTAGSALAVVRMEPSYA